MSKSSPLESTLDFDSYRESITKDPIGSESDANFLDNIHLSENDHTNILWQILQFKRYGQFPFLKSFVKEVLGLPYYQTFGAGEPLEPISGTQCRAIGLEKKDQKGGFIDLLLKSPRKVIIIENKVCGATDMKWQLLRYYYTFVKYEDNSENQEIIDNSFQKLYEDFKESTKESCNPEDVYIVYLTKDGSKEPASNSIGSLRNNIIEGHYIPVSYFGDDDDRKCILRWLKEDVLPNVPYIESGHLLQSLILYISYLENTMDAGGDMPLDKTLYKKLRIDDCTISKLIEAYETECSSRAGNTENENSEDSNQNIAEEDKLRTQFLKFIKACINYKLIDIANGVNKVCKTDWVIRWNPNYIMLFKKAWFDNPNYPKTPNISLMHWELLRRFSNKDGFNKWEFHLEGPGFETCMNDVKENWAGCTLTKSGRIKGTLTYGKDESYILKEGKGAIITYFEELFTNGDFVTKTKDVEDILNAKLNPNVADISTDGVL